MLGLWHINVTIVLLVDLIMWIVLLPMYKRDPDPVKVCVVIVDVCGCACKSAPRLKQVAFYMSKIFKFSSYCQV